ncbi:MAG: four helix bundle protein [Pseudomonadaceae bacterium]|nr:four helix bundle protein [Pseudomonadaceae bacterium]
MDFERLEVWRRSKDLSVELYRGLSSCLDYGFRNQLTRSGLSVPSNIAEGMERSSDAEKTYFLNVAKGSCAELRTQLLIGKEIGYLDAALADRWITEARELSMMLTGLIKRVSK